MLTNRKYGYRVVHVDGIGTAVEEVFLEADSPHKAAAAAVGAAHGDYRGGRWDVYGGKDCKLRGSYKVEIEAVDP